MKKRLLLTLMSVMLLFGISAVSVFAESTVNNAEEFGKAIASDNFDIVLGQDLTLNEVTISKSGTLDLAGHTITEAVQIKLTSGTLTIKDGGTNGLITCANGTESGTWGAFLVSGKDTKLILESGKIYAANNIALNVSDNATAEIKGGVVESNYTDLSAANAQPGSKITVNGGTVKAAANALTAEGGTIQIDKGTITSTGINTTAAAYGVYVGESSESGTVQKGTAIINGGNITGVTNGVYVESGSADITGGIIVANGENASLGKKAGDTGAIITVIGGAFSSSPINFCPNTEIFGLFAEVDKPASAEGTKKYYCVLQEDAEAVLASGDTLAILNSNPKAEGPRDVEITIDGDLFNSITIKNENHDGKDIIVNGITIPNSYDSASGQTSATIILADEASNTVIRLSALTGTKFTLPEGSVFTAPSGKRFAGWSDGTKTYKAGDKVTLEADADAAEITFTAQWENIPPAAPTKGDPSEIKATDKAKSAVDSDGKSLVQDTDYKLKDGGADFLPAYTDTFTGEKTVKITIGNKYYEFTVKGTKAALIDIATLEAEIEDVAYTSEPAFPTVTLTTADGTVVDPENYEITYNNPLSTEVGTYGFVITGKKAYTGSVEKEYNIIPPTKEIAKVVPGKTGKAKKSFTVKWKKASDTESGGIGGYEVKYSVKKNFKKAKTQKVKQNTAKKVKIEKGVKKGKKYFVMLRAFKKVDDVKYYSDWSAVKKVKTKK